MDSGPATPEGFRAAPEIDADGDKTGRIICYPDFSPNCIVVVNPRKGEIDSTGFVSLSEPTPFHDEVLIKTSAEINAILSRLMADKGARKGHLHVIGTPDGPMLAWVHGTVNRVDDVRAAFRNSHA